MLLTIAKIAVLVPHDLRCIVYFWLRIIFLLFFQLLRFRWAHIIGVWQGQSDCTPTDCSNLQGAWKCLLNEIFPHLIEYVLFSLMWAMNFWNWCKFARVQCELLSLVVSAVLELCDQHSSRSWYTQWLEMIRNTIGKDTFVHRKKSHFSINHLVHRFNVVIVS